MAGLLERLLRPRAMNIWDDRLWEPAASRIGSKAYSGVNVSATTALMSSAVWACVRLIAESIAGLPIIVYRRQSDGGKRRAPEHPLYSVLHDSPNEQQTAFTFVRTLMVQALLYGNGYAQIVPGPRGAVDRLEPIFAENIRAEAIPGEEVRSGSSDGLIINPARGIRYQVRGPDGIERPLNAEDVFHLPGLSLDGTSGLSLVRYARESIGLALAAEAYSAKFYSQNAQPGGVLKSAKVLSDTAFNRLRESWEERQQGPENWHRVAILEDGVEWVQTGMTHQDAELIAQLDWSAADVARFFNVPLHMIQLMTKSTSWGSGIEEMGIEFVVFSLLPWVRNIEQLITKKLIIAPQTYFAEMLLDSLMRGKMVDRYNSYSVGRNGGWLTVNEIRGFENMNPVEGGDILLQPLNMSPVGEPPAPPPRGERPGRGKAEGEEAAGPDEGRPRGGGPTGATRGHYYLLVYEAARRVIRKELAAMRKAAGRLGTDNYAWLLAINEFYAAKHVEFVRETMGMGRDDAERYVSEQAAELSRGGPEVMEDWETRRVADLVALALGEGKVDYAVSE